MRKWKITIFLFLIVFVGCTHAQIRKERTEDTNGIVYLDHNMSEEDWYGISYLLVKENYQVIPRSLAFATMKRLQRRGEITGVKCLDKECQIQLSKFLTADYLVTVPTYRKELRFISLAKETIVQIWKIDVVVQTFGTTHKKTDHKEYKEEKAREHSSSKLTKGMSAKEVLELVGYPYDRTSFDESVLFTYENEPLCKRGVCFLWFDKYGNLDSCCDTKWGICPFEITEDS